MMRRWLLALCSIGGAACAHSQESSERACTTVPVPIEGRYSDGTVMVRASPVENSSASQWEYFYDTGVRAMIETRTPNEGTTFTVYYPNGEKRLEGSYHVIIDEGALALQPHAEWQLFNDDGSPLAHALFSNGVLLSREQWDKFGASVPWSLPDTVFQFRQVHTLFSASPVYPRESERLGRGATTCTLVCVDHEGKLRALFALNEAPKEFERAARNAIKSSTYVPQAIGEVSVPVCAPSKVVFRTKDLGDPKVTVTYNDWVEGLMDVRKKIARE